MTPPSLRNPDSPTPQFKSDTLSFTFFIEEHTRFKHTLQERSALCSFKGPLASIAKIACEHFQLKDPKDQTLIDHLIVNEPSWNFCTLTVNDQKKLHIRINNNMRAQSFVNPPSSEPSSLKALFFESLSFQELQMEGQPSLQERLKKS